MFLAKIRLARINETDAAFSIPHCRVDYPRYRFKHLTFILSDSQTTESMSRRKVGNVLFVSE